MVPCPDPTKHKPMTSNPAFWFLIGVFLIFWGAGCVHVGTFIENRHARLTEEQKGTLALFVMLGTLIVLGTLVCLGSVLLNALLQTP